MSEENKLITERKQKISDWEAAGFAAYAKDFDRTHTSQEARNEAKKSQEKKSLTPNQGFRDAKILLTEGPKNNVRMCGRIINLRDMGKLAFLRIFDIEGDFQICMAKNILQDQFKPFLKMLDLGDFCGFSGEFFITNHGEPTLLVKEIFPLTKSIRSLPEKWVGIKDQEACYRERNLDLISNRETFNRFKLRSKMVQEIRNFFEKKQFLEVETSILQSQTGGAMAKVFETHHKSLDHNFVLRIAMELDLKRAVGGGMERIFEIGKNFRNEGSDPSHLQEFTMCEWYASYKNLETNKQWTEELFHKICKNVFEKSIFKVVDAEGKETEINFEEKFEEARFPDLIKKYANLDMFTASNEEIQKKAKELGVEKINGIGRANLLDDIYKKTARPKLIQPTFVFDYPEALKPLARPNGDGTALCFQLVVNSWEIVNSYEELIDPQIQRRLLEEQSAAKMAGDDEAMDVDEVFLKAMEHGFPPMTGSGFGIDRLMAIFSGQLNLRDTVLFPTMKPKKSTQKTGKSKEAKIAVALINKNANLERWQEMNTISHLNAAFGARVGKSLFTQDEIGTEDNKKIKLNIQHAIMIKEIPGNAQIIEITQKAKEANLEVSEFTREMIEKTDDRKIIKQTKQKKGKDLDFLGVLLFGKKSEVEKLTKDFPLFRG